MATRIKRGTSAKRGATRAKPRTAQRSRANAFLARLPFTEEQMQKAATIGILGILALGGVITAQFMGLPGMVQEEMALAANLPVPPVYLLPERGINAFAAGYSPADAGPASIEWALLQTTVSPRVRTI